MGFSPLTPEQVDILRAIVHPEIIISYLPSNPGPKPAVNKLSIKTPALTPKSPEIKVLDRKQEINAKKIKEGHRIVCGVAGSGKTVLLLSRARWLCERDPESNILLLCYNVVFGTFLKCQLMDCKQVKAFHFDEWAIKNGIHRYWNDPITGESEKDEPLGQRLLDRLQERTGDFRKYDAVLIDEAQDFSPTWFKCALEAMKDPSDGDLLIVCDGNQGIRPIHSISWKSLGIKASGRTLHTKLDLDKNYRNTYEILKLASLFASKDTEPSEDSFSIVPVNPETAIRRGPKPVLIHCNDHKDECKIIIRISKILLNGFNSNGTKIDPLFPEDIGVLYGGRPKQDHHLFEEFIFNFARMVPVIWLNEDQDSKKKVVDPGVKVQTTHSAKGLQYRAVFVMWADTFTPYDTDEEFLKRRLLYVALTRAEDYLFITYSNSNDFIDKMISSGCVIKVESDGFDPMKIF